MHKGAEPWRLVHTADGGAVWMAAAAAALKADITYASIKETKTKIIGM